MPDENSKYMAPAALCFNGATHELAVGDRVVMTRDRTGWGLTIEPCDKYSGEKRELGGSPFSFSPVITLVAVSPDEYARRSSPIDTPRAPK